MGERSTKAHANGTDNWSRYGKKLTDKISVACNGNETLSERGSGTPNAISILIPLERRRRRER